MFSEPARLNNHLPEKASSLPSPPIYIRTPHFERRFLVPSELLVSWQFSGPYGVTKYGSGWRKDIVNQCLEFALTPPLLVVWETKDGDEDEKGLEREDRIKIRTWWLSKEITHLSWTQFTTLCSLKIREMGKRAKRSGKRSIEGMTRFSYQTKDTCGGHSSHVAVWETKRKIENKSGLINSSIEIFLF